MNFKIVNTYLVLATVLLFSSACKSDPAPVVTTGTGSGGGTAGTLTSVDTGTFTGNLANGGGFDVFIDWMGTDKDKNDVSQAINRNGDIVVWVKDAGGTTIVLTDVTVTGGTVDIPMVDKGNKWENPNDTSAVYSSYVIDIDAGANGKATGITFNPSLAFGYHTISSPTVNASFATSAAMPITWDKSGADIIEVDLSDQNYTVVPNTDTGSYTVPGASMAFPTNAERIRIKREKNLPLGGASASSQVNITYRAGLEPINVTGNTYNFTFNGAGLDTNHAGLDFDIRIVDTANNFEVDNQGQTAIGTSGSGDYIFTSNGTLVENRTYNVDFYVDVDGNGNYDAPPTDHAWRVVIGPVTADVVTTWSHNTNFMDIQFP